LFEKAANILFKKFKANNEFAKLVQPDNEQSSFVPDTRTSRSMSIVLKKHNLPTATTGKSKKSCCH
jgi:hypothetical protein